MTVVPAALDAVDRVQDRRPRCSTPILLPARRRSANFLYVFTEVPFLRYLLNTFFVAGDGDVVALFFHSMAGYALARLRFPGRETIFLAMFSTFLVSLPVIIVPLFILVRALGMLNSYAGLIIPAIFNAFGIFLLRQFYLSLPRELEEAALIDGAGYWRIYWSIILPLSRPILSALAILFFLANWNAFLWPLTVTSDPDLWLVQVGDRQLPEPVHRRLELHHGRFDRRRAADADHVRDLPAADHGIRSRPAASNERDADRRIQWTMRASRRCAG